MIFTPTILPGAYLLDLERRTDQRGFFARTFCANEFADHGLETQFVQGNMSRTLKKHTLRGMHFQTDGAEEAKLVRCTKGALYDVILDLRPDSPTRGQYFAAELSAENGRQLYIPKGFAHGFLTLTDDSEIAYLVSAFYSPGKEGGIRWNDPAFGIKWPTDKPLLSGKDANYADYRP